MMLFKLTHLILIIHSYTNLSTDLQGRSIAKTMHFLYKQNL